MENKSFWIDKFNLESYESLNENITTEVCIIGGGITGITSAYYLSNKGLDVTVIEKNFVASKTTGHTTGKVSVQHGLFYKYLLDNYGVKVTEKYLKTNLEALKNVEEIIKDNNISCDFEKRDSYIYTCMPQKYKDIEDEVNICKQLGLKASFEKNIELPINIQGAIKTKDQAQFNPVKYLDGLCKVVVKNGAKIYENSQVTEYKKVDGKYEVLVSTKTGVYKVLADKVIVATRYPIYNFPGMFFVKNYQELEYVMCVEVNKDIENLGMYLSADTPAISYRSVLCDNGKRYLFVAGNGSKTGINCDNAQNYKFLEDNLKNIFGEYNIMYKWTAEDCISLDKIPYIGRYSILVKNMYVATGFKKWGMTTSNIAANIITNKILNQSDKYSVIFNSNRLKPIKNKEEMKNMIKDTYNSLVKEKFVKRNGKRYCTHLGCELEFNKTTNTWDCPCHGSRFEKNGDLIDGPSQKDLKE